MNDTITLTIDLHQSEILNLNQRLNRWEKARRTAAIRNKAMVARLQNQGPQMDRARCDAVLSFRDSRPRDRSNWMPTVKAGVDGVVSGPPGVQDWPHKVLPDDDDTHLDGPHLKLAVDRSLRHGWARLALTFQNITTTLMTRLYVAGPMTGRPRFNYPAFHEAADRLREVGYLVTNPADEYDITKPLPAYDVMLAGVLRKSLDCDGIAVLPGWEDSHGARLEVHVAEALSRPVRPVDDWLARARAAHPQPQEGT